MKIIEMFDLPEKEALRLFNLALKSTSELSRFKTRICRKNQSESRTRTENDSRFARSLEFGPFFRPFGFYTVNKRPLGAKKLDGNKAIDEVYAIVDAYPDARCGRVELNSSDTLEEALGKIEAVLIKASEEARKNPPGFLVYEGRVDGSTASEHASIQQIPKAKKAFRIKDLQELLSKVEAKHGNLVVGASDSFGDFIKVDEIDFQVENCDVRTPIPGKTHGECSVEKLKILSITSKIDTNPEPD